MNKTKTRNYHILIHDETNLWDDKIVVLAGGKIFGLYLFDPELHVYCCSMFPAYQCEPLWSIPLSYPHDFDDEMDELYDALDEAAIRGVDVSYLDIHNTVHIDSGIEIEIDEDGNPNVSEAVDELYANGLPDSVYDIVNKTFR